MKVAGAPSPHEEPELRQVPPTRARKKSLQAPEDLVHRQLLPVASAKLPHACADHLKAGNAGPLQVMVDMVMDLLDRIARKAASILELEAVEGKDTMTVNEIHYGAKLVLRDGNDR